MRSFEIVSCVLDEVDGDRVTIVNFDGDCLLNMIVGEDIKFLKKSGGWKFVDVAEMAC